MKSKLELCAVAAALLLAIQVRGQQNGPEVVACVDVGAMVRAVSHPDGGSVVPPLYAAHARAAEMPVAKSASQSLVAIDHDLLAQLVKDAAPGVEIRVDGTRFWISGAEASVKAATVRLAALRTALCAEVRIRVALVGRAPQKAVLTALETAAFLAEAPLIFAAEGVGRSDAPFALRGGRVLPFVADYSVEVAQKSSISSPVVAHIRLGLRATAAAYSLPNNKVLARVGGVYSEAPEAMRSFPAGDPLRFGEIQSPEPVSTGMSGAAVLESGGSFVAGGTAAGGVWLVQATRGGGPTGNDLHPVAGMIRNRFELTGLDSGIAGDPFDGLFTGDDGDEGSGASPVAFENLLALCASRFRTGEAGLTLTQSGLLVVKGTPEVKDEVGRLLPELAETLLRNCAVELRFGVVDAGKAAKLAAGTTDAALLPSGRMFATALAGERIRLFMGAENAFLSAAEAEIAQESSLLDPIVRVRFQGVVFEGVLDRDEAGLVGVTGRFSRRAEAGPPAASPRLSSGAALDLSGDDACDLRSSVAATPGAWKSFGSATVKDGVFVVMVRAEG